MAGKPERPLLDETMRRVGGRRPLMVGDRLDTDIDGAVNAGVDSLLVMTGVSGPPAPGRDAGRATADLRGPDLGGALDVVPESGDEGGAAWAAWSAVRRTGGWSSRTRAARGTGGGWWRPPPGRTWTSRSRWTRPAQAAERRLSTRGPVGVGMSSAHGTDAVPSDRRVPDPEDDEATLTVASRAAACGGGVRRRPPVTPGWTRSWSMEALDELPLAEHTAVFEQAHERCVRPWTPTAARVPPGSDGPPDPGPVPRRLRLDAELVRRGLARSRDHAAELITGGRGQRERRDGRQAGHGRHDGRGASWSASDPDRPRLRVPGWHKLGGRARRPSSRWASP